MASCLPPTAHSLLTMDVHANMAPVSLAKEKGSWFCSVSPCVHSPPWDKTDDWVN